MAKEFKLPDLGEGIHEGELLAVRVGVGQEPFLAVLRQLRGSAVADEWAAFMAWLEPSCRAVRALPLLALRPGLGMATSFGWPSPALIAQAGRLAALGGSFGPLMRRHLRDPFLLAKEPAAYARFSGDIGHGRCCVFEQRD